MRLSILLLFVTSFAYGQANIILGLHQRTELSPTINTEFIIDNAVFGTSNNQNNYVGSWPLINGAKSNTYNNTFSATNVGTDDGNNGNDPYVNIYFNGFKAEIIAERWPTHGIMAISIDGGPEEEFDQYSATQTESIIAGVPQVVWSSSTSVNYTGLTNSDHVLKIRNTGDKNAQSSATNTVVDALRVTTSGSAPTPPPVTSANWYVAKTGCTGACSDSNNGTSRLTAFLTIQKASEVAQPGDNIAIYDGTYRETIAPVNSGTSGNPIIYQAASGNTVIVSGLDAISNGAWASYSGNIYRAAVSNGAMYTEYMTGFNKDNLQYNNTQLLSQQLFKDGVMQMQAAHPKTATVEAMLDRPSQRSKADIGTFGPTTITDSQFSTYGSGGLNGGVVWVSGWFITRTRNITGQSSNTITYQDTGDGGDHAFSNFYKVTNKLQLLTQAKEWHYDGTYFYFWQTGGGSPTGVEYKKRNWGFDLRNRSFITVEGINFIGCEAVMTNPSSLSITIDNIRSTHTSHHVLESNGGNDGYNDSNVQTGLKLLGAGSILKNSEFNYSSGVTVWVGSNVTVQNNKFQNGGYGGFYPGFIKLAWNGLVGAANVNILNNTFYRSGRGAIEVTANSQAVTYSNIRIGYNDFSKFNMITVDGGAIYGARQSRFTGSRIDHNWFHNDGGFDEAGTGQQRGIQVNGTYWDQASGPTQYDHNIHWNGISGVGRTGGYSTDFYTQSYYHEVGTYAIGKNYFYNCIFATATGGAQYSYVVYNNYGPTKDVFRNVIARAGLNVDWGQNGAAADQANSVLSNVNPLFTGGSLTTPESYFTLQSGSPARGIGATISGVNDGDTAPKDAGTYWYGQTTWVPGYVAVTYVPTP